MKRKIYLLIYKIFKYELETLRDTYLNKYLLKIESFNDNCDNVSEEECKN